MKRIEKFKTLELEKNEMARITGATSGTKMEEQAHGNADCGVIAENEYVDSNGNGEQDCDEKTFTVNIPDGSI